MKHSIFSQNRIKLQELLWLMLESPKLSNTELALYFKEERRVVHWYRIRHGLFEVNKRSTASLTIQQIDANVKAFKDNPVDVDGNPMAKPKQYSEYLKENG